MKPNLRRSAAVLVVLLLPLTLSEAPAGGRAAGASWTSKTRRIAPGLALTKIVAKKPRWRIFVLTADPSARLTLDVALAGAEMPARARTSVIAERQGAIAAVNGDFGSSFGGPAHPFAQDGDLVRTSADAGALFAWSEDEQNTFFGRPAQLVTAVDAAGMSWTIDRWNDGTPGVGEIAAYSPVGGTLAAPPAGSCSVRLIPFGTLAPASAGTGLTQTYTVEQAGCFESSLERNGGVVLSAIPGSDEANRLLALAPGTSFTITWTFGWANVYDAIGGVPLLVAEGQDVVGDCVGSVCRRNPRTGVGMTQDGKVLLVVVDGRQHKWSVGATMHEFAEIFMRLGATSALNLDGGGSTTMVVRGNVVNRVSDGGERSVSTALLVLPGPDPDEP
ncbi:MAG: phosphodiester glycosidase family protein [Actinomycetota bacterium]